MRLIAAIVFAVLAMVGAPLAEAFDGNSIEAALTAKFNLGPSAAPADNPALDPSTLLIVRKAEIVAVPYGPSAIPESNWNYKDGALHPPGLMARTGTILAGNLGNNGQRARQLAKGERAYLVRWGLNLKANKISFIIFQCNLCNGAIEPNTYRAAVTFQFPKAYLETAEASEIVATIGEVFTVLYTAPAAPTQVPVAETPPPVEEPASPAPAPVNIQLGQTPDQVVSLLGQPDRKATIGSKEIYFYKDMKITFQSGAVSDVQ